MDIVERWSSIYMVLVQVRYKVSNENQSLVKISDVLPGHAIHFQSWQPGDTKLAQIYLDLSLSSQNIPISLKERQFHKSWSTNNNCRCKFGMKTYAL
jgi:hypothetical protein